MASTNTNLKRETLLLMAYGAELVPRVHAVEDTALGVTVCGESTEGMDTLPNRITGERYVQAPGEWLCADCRLVIAMSDSGTVADFGIKTIGAPAVMSPMQRAHLGSMQARQRETLKEFIAFMAAKNEQHSGLAAYVDEFLRDSWKEFYIS